MRIGDRPTSEIANALTGDGLPLSVGPFHLLVKSPFDAFARGIHFLYAQHACSEQRDFYDACIQLIPPKGFRRLRKGNTCLVVDGEEWYRTSRQLALAYFEWGTNWSIFRRTHRFLVIHAATLARNGVGLMMPAAPGSGKSTLCAALAHRGWRLFSDELALIDPEDARLVPLAKPVCLKDQSIAVIREFAPAAKFGPRMYDAQEERHVAHVRPPLQAVDNVQQTALPQLIVFPQYEPSSPTILAPLSRSDAFLQVARQSFNYSLLGASGFKLLGRVLKNCDCYRLTYSNLDEAIQQIDALAASASQSLVPNAQC